MRQRLVCGDPDWLGEGRVRIPSPGGEGQGEGGLFFPDTMSRCAHVAPVIFIHKADFSAVLSASNS
jgi:hypothetical protein